MKGIIPPFSDFCSIQVLSGLDVAQRNWEMYFAKYMDPNANLTWKHTQSYGNPWLLCKTIMSWDPVSLDPNVSL